MSQQLFATYQLGDLQLKNRVVMAPLTRSRAIDNIPNDLMAKYYGQRAGAGLIITEGTSPSPNGLGYPRIPGCFTQEQVEGWQKVTKAVHDDDGKIFLQIMHTGRVTHPGNLPPDGEIIAPSAVALTDTKMHVDGEGELEMPLARSMSIKEIEHAVTEFADCAKLAIKAGFDGVELHGANGYLIEQFINPASNLRDDHYGGSIENRLRFVRNVAEATVAAIGADRVGMRISPYGAFGEMKSDFEGVNETFTQLAKMMSEVGLVYLHIVDHSAMGTPEVPAEIKQKIREHFTGTLILSGGYDAERAEADLQADKGDLVAFGRPYIANPDLVHRMKEGAELNEPDQDTFYTPGAEGYTDYPVLEEATTKS